MKAKDFSAMSTLQRKQVAAFSLTKDRKLRVKEQAERHFYADLNKSQVLTLVAELMEYAKHIDNE